MVKSIIKRIIVGVGIALALMFIKGNLLLSVKAYEISSFNAGAQAITANTGTAFADFNISGNPWANWRYGILHFDFGINKTQGSSTDNLLVPRFVQATSDTTVYICNFGTVSYNNSTWSGATYSVTCPMDLGPPGLTKITIGFMPFSGGTSASTTYNISIGGWMTFETRDESQINVNVDTSSTNNAINNQTQNDNQNTQNIINNNNQNTQSINNNITDDTGVSDNDISDIFEDLEESNTPISDLLTMPITLVNAYISGFSGTCQSISLGRLYNTNLVIPCINLSEKFGSSLWNLIDILFSLFMIYALSQLFITAFDGITSLKDDFSLLYGLDGRHIARGTRMDRYGD